MLPEFIVVEVNLDEFIVAQLMSDAPPTYRKFLAAVGRPAAEKAQVALMPRDQPEFDPTSRQVRGTINPEARVRVEKGTEGIIRGASRNSEQGAIGADDRQEEDRA